MGQVERDFAGHPLWPLVEAFGQKLDAAPEIEDAVAVEHLARLRWMHQQLRSVRDRNVTVQSVWV